MKLLTFLLALPIMLWFAIAAPNYTTGPSSSTPSVTSTMPIVTWSDNRKTVTLDVGQTFALKLGQGLRNLVISNEQVIQRIPNIALKLGYQGIFKANAAGTSTIMSTGYYPRSTFYTTIIVK